MDDEVSKATEILFLGIVEELRALQLPINGGRIALGVGFHFQARRKWISRAGQKSTSSRLSPEE
jgi:hypothetical protein